MDKAERAVELYDSGCNCAQAMLYAFSGNDGLEARQVIGLSSAFGGGLAGTGNVCGAVTGALMVIGLRYGQTVPGDREGSALAKQEGLRLLRAVEARHQTLLCRQLMGYDTSTPEGAAAAKAARVRELVCRPLVGEIAEYLEQLEANNAEMSGTERIS